MFFLPFLIHRNESLLHVLQFLDVINMKDTTQKAHFYKTTLRDALAYIPRVNYTEYPSDTKMYINSDNRDMV